jgi:hypothetical protein
MMQSKNSIRLISRIDQIRAELIQARDNYVLRYINLLILFGIRKNCHRNGKTLLLYLFTKRVIKLSVVTIEEYHC